jgi:hypothetical protein
MFETCFGATLPVGLSFCDTYGGAVGAVRPRAEPRGRESQVDIPAATFTAELSVPYSETRRTVKCERAASAVALMVSCHVITRLF